jgi:hypothetical protein
MLALWHHLVIGGEETSAAKESRAPISQTAAYRALTAGMCDRYGLHPRTDEMRIASRIPHEPPAMA